MRAKKRLERNGDITIKEIIGLLLAIAAILILLPVIASIVGLVLPSADQGSLESLSYIDKSINALMDSTETRCFIPIYVQPDKAFVGFDSGSKDVTEPCGLVHTKVRKPVQKCGIDACICLCDGGMGDLSSNDCLQPLECYTYDDLMQIRTRDDKGKVFDMVLYGESCWLGSNQEVKLAIIEKSRNAAGVVDTIHIYRVDKAEGIRFCNDLYRDEDINPT